MNRDESFQKYSRVYHFDHQKNELLLLLLLLLPAAIEFSLGGSSRYTSTDKTNNIHKRNNTKTQYKQYKTR